MSGGPSAKEVPWSPRTSRRSALLRLLQPVPVPVPGPKTTLKGLSPSRYRSGPRKTISLRLTAASDPGVRGLRRDVSRLLRDAVGPGEDAPGDPAGSRPTSAGSYLGGTHKACRPAPSDGADSDGASSDGSLTEPRQPGQSGGSCVRAGQLRCLLELSLAQSWARREALRVLAEQRCKMVALEHLGMVSLVSVCVADSRSVDSSDVARTLRV